ncbi:hypothetical protein M378DRAFT_166171 [Amanita muscaria Koide BX008]|uniref:Uncharacterized protein n=1 Tax=Amanita muscaria (strain Koide BX008) TaxID=946122 RepID=A0A0C2X043_AMAMK|nr:hypothetical protein M378DRAFT_166171 [Amanita muscaria Koide BX008]
MRFAIVWFLSLLLLPSLVISREDWGARHGDIVHYQASHGRDRGLVVGRSGGHLHIAPLANGSPHPASGLGVIAHSDRIVEAHPSNVIATGYKDRGTADHIANEHRHDPPDILEGGGPLHRRSGGMRSRR